MKKIFPLFIISLFLFTNAIGQKGKDKKKNSKFKSTPIIAAFGDSIRTDSIVYYETEVGYIMPDLSSKFMGRWQINVMSRQARVKPDSLANSFIQFNEDTLFTAYVGCNKLSGTYIIKGPTIKFKVTDTLLTECADDLEAWFIKLIEERVSYFGVDEKILYLKDVAFNIVFDCAKKGEENQ